MKRGVTIIVRADRVLVWTIVIGLLLATLQSDSRAAEPPQGAPPAELRAQANDGLIRPILQQHCLACHSGEKPKANLDLNQLATDFADQAAQKQWLTVLRRIEAGEMPPKAKPRPAEAEVGTVSAWIRANVDAAAAARRATEGRVVQRRLNRTEYENTIRDLLGIEISLKELLPMDTSADGFDNSGEALHVSSFLIDRYLEAADAALNVAIVNAPQPRLVANRFSCKEERQVKNATERVFLKQDDTVVFFSSSPWSAVTTGQF